MKRTTKTITLQNTAQIKERILIWAQQFETVFWLDSNNYKQTYSNYDAVLAVDDFTSIKTDYFNAFEQLQEYYQTTRDYIFGYLSYDLKNDVEKLQSANFDGLQFPDLYFFQPKKLFFFKGDELTMSYLPMVDDEIELDFEEIKKIQQSNNPTIQQSKNPIKIKMRIHKDEYKEKVGKMLEHIHRGDIYEANFCQEFYAENTQINPLKVYQDLNAISSPPFASFIKMNEQFALCASPERYIKKEGLKVISQPIKGTAKRLKNKAEDQALATKLANDEKERAENVMIVDLVRNDLSKTATKGSVQVEELCKVYSFEQVHQLISTVVSGVSEETNVIDILRTTFPMGSMTGAPKISAMQIIENLENTRRGLYSGAIGYLTPQGDFDFNVVIRSILYNAEKRYVSYSVGGAITAKSDIESEYQECLLKAKAMKAVLTGE